MDLNLETYLREMTIDHEKHSTRHLAGMFSIMSDWMNDGNLEAINQLMRDIDITKYRPEVIVGILRYSSTFKEELLEWNGYLDRVRHEINQRLPEQVDDILRGLNHVW